MATLVMESGQDAARVLRLVSQGSTFVEHSKTPSLVMYSHLKELGIMFRDAASLLMKTDVSFAGRTIESRIAEKTQLSRRFVHVAPGELPVELFRDFRESSEDIMQMLLAQSASADIRSQTANSLCEHFRSETARDMAASLAAFRLGSQLYLNTVGYIDRLRTDGEFQRLKLHIMLFITVGCTADERLASNAVISHAAGELHATFSTPATEQPAVMRTAVPGDMPLALMRIAEGGVVASASSYKLDPLGTELGLLSDSDCAITDVGEDVSRRHARIWREDGAWYIADLDSTNGTSIVRGSDLAEVVVAPPRANRDVRLVPEQVRIEPADIIKLGNTTSFVVVQAASSM